MGVGNIDRNLGAVAIVLGITEYRSADIARYAKVFKQKNRLYHALNHTEDMMSFDELDLIMVLGYGEEYTKSQMWQKLAGFKHDLFQLKIDGNAPKGFEWVAGNGYKEGQYIVNKPDEVSDEIYQIVLGVFGFKDGEVLEKGANEFLTALENAHDMKQRGAKTKDIIAVTACIEATIPFRSKNKIYKLCDRIKNLRLDFSTEEIDAIGYSACNFANRDVENFAGRFLKFIDKMRKNIPELSPQARADCKATDARDCFVGTLKLMQGIHTGIINVYCQYKAVPNAAKKERISQRSKRNAGLAVTYLQARYISSTILGALATKFNKPEARLNEIAGDVEALIAKDPSIKADLSKEEQKVLQALNGKDQTDLVGVDLSAAPIASFVFRILGQAGVCNMFEDAQKCDVTIAASAQEFLLLVQRQLKAGNYHIILGELQGLKAQGCYKD